MDFSCAGEPERGSSCLQGGEREGGLGSRNYINLSHVYVSKLYSFGGGEEQRKGDGRENRSLRLSEGPAGDFGGGVTGGQDKKGPLEILL